jgi:hypothetical protein
MLVTIREATSFPLGGACAHTMSRALAEGPCSADATSSKSSGCSRLHTQSVPPAASARGGRSPPGLLATGRRRPPPRRSRHGDVHHARVAAVRATTHLARSTPYDGHR